MAAGARRLAALLAAALLAIAAPRASADDDFGSMHTVFSAECDPFFEWQSIAVVYSHRKAGVAGPITRLLSCTDAQLAAYGCAPGARRCAALEAVPTVLVPSWTDNPHNGDHYTAYNKPAAVDHWLRTARPREKWVLVIDPDMVVRDSFAGWGAAYGAAPGAWAVSAHFGYMVGTANNLSATHVPHVAPRRDAAAGPRGRRADQASALVLMARADLERVAPQWLAYSERVRDDPMAWKETGDEYAKGPGEKPWIAEMYGYAFGAAAAGVWHRPDRAAMLYPGHTPADRPLVLHYGKLFRVDGFCRPGEAPRPPADGKGGPACGGSWAFRKHWFHEFDAGACPPWPHLGDGGAAAAEAAEGGGGARGGLFPPPPGPEALAHKPPRERYRDLLASSVVATVNAALCERHLARCPPSRALGAACGAAARLEAAIDAALEELEADNGGAGADALCRDRRPAAECGRWAAQSACGSAPAFMHVVCRASCGLCRLPLGGPAPAPADWTDPLAAEDLDRPPAARIEALDRAEALNAATAAATRRASAARRRGAAAAWEARRAAAARRARRRRAAGLLAGAFALAGCCAAAAASGRAARWRARRAARLLPLRSPLWRGASGSSSGGSTPTAFAGMSRGLLVRTRGGAGSGSSFGGGSGRSSAAATPSYARPRGGGGQHEV